MAQAVKDGYLVDYVSVESKLKFIEQGIVYDELSEEDREEYEETFEDENGRLPEAIGSSALNTWIFNEDTIKKVLNVLMTEGIKIDYGQKLGKTIIFAKNHDHAEKILEIFNKEYPYLPDYAKVIDNYMTYAQSAIDEFSDAKKMPQIAISVDMLDTGIDVPEVVNLVFFKKVMSKAKFWQMIGRGTRLCPGLLDGEDKDKFYIFDFCGNFEFFRMNKGKATANMIALQGAVFNLKFEISYKLQDIKYQNDRLIMYRNALVKQMSEKVKELPRDNFAVKQHLKYVELYSVESNYQTLTYEDTLIVREEVAPLILPEEDEASAVRFDALMYGIELANLLGNKYSRARNDLLKKTAGVAGVANIPEIQAQSDIINKILNTDYVDNADINDFEEIRQRLRSLMKYLPRGPVQKYQTTPQIVNVAKSLISANQNRLEKQMISNRPDGHKPVFNAPGTEENESLWIADTILDNVAKNMKYSDHTILVRAASQTRSLEEAFIKRKVPYKILSGAKFYESEEIRTVLSYMRMVYSLTDMDLLYTISRPRRGFGKKSVEKLKNAAAQNNCSLFKALGKQIDDGDITQKNVIEYYNAISELHDTYVAYTCTDIVNKCLDMGYRQALEQDIDQTRLDNVSELIRTITALEEDNQEKVELADLLSHFALFSAQDEDGEYNVVKVMTIHTAKGLEFDTVFVPGLVEGQFPSSRLRNEDEYEEERRLLYVAMTRAKNMLYLSTYRKKDGRFAARPSAFLSDIDTNLLDCINNSRVLIRGVTEQMLPKAVFEVGDKVRHKVFGTGEIVKVDKVTQTYEIQFENIRGTRRLMFRAELGNVEN